MTASHNNTTHHDGTDGTGHTTYMYTNRNTASIASSASTGSTVAQKHDNTINSEDDRSQNQKLVLTYLQHVYKSIQILKLTNDDYNTNTTNNNNSTSTYQHNNVERYMDDIARDLLHVCNPTLLSLNIPQHNFVYFDQYHNDVIARTRDAMAKHSQKHEQMHKHTHQHTPTSESNNKNNSPNPNHDCAFEIRPRVLSTRKDILRNIFYNMAPIAYDISAHVASIVAKHITKEKYDDNDKDSSTQSKKDIIVQSFILFSFWIKQAPQIKPLVTDLFRLSQFTSPFDHAILIMDNDNQNRDDHDYNDGDLCQPMDIDNDDNNNNIVDDTVITSCNQNIKKYVLIPIQELSILCEAIHHIVEYYTNIDELASLKSWWWEWSKLYTLLSYKNKTPPNIPYYDSITHTLCPNTINTINGDDDGDLTRENILTFDPNDIHEAERTFPSIPNYGYATPNRTYDPFLACKWFVSRVAAHLLCLSGTSKGLYLERLNVRQEFVPWVTHPWIVEEEREQFQELMLRCQTCFTFLNWNELIMSDGMDDDNDDDNDDENMDDDNEVKKYPFLLEDVVIDATSPIQIRRMVSLHPSLVHLGNGVILPCRNPISSMILNADDVSSSAKPEGEDGVESTTCRKSLVITPTTARNLELLGTALSADPYPPPILVCGPRGSGKSSLIREIAHLCSTSAHTNNSNDGSSSINLLEIHVDEETDSKTLK